MSDAKDVRAVRTEWPVRGARPLIVLMAMAWIAACAPRSTTYEALGEVVDEPVATATVRAIADEPARYLGRVVTVAGEVGRVLGPRWFTIGGREFGGEVLVLGRSAVPALVNNLADSGLVMNDIVQVTGVVRVFEEDALEREIGGIDLDGDIFDPFDAEPVIVMTHLDVTPRADVATAVAVPVPFAVPVFSEVEIFVPNRASLAGRAASLFGVRVDSVVSQRAFWVGRQAGRRLLVVLNDSAQATGMTGRATTASLQRGDTVFVAGVLREVPSDFAAVRSEWGLDAAAEAAVRTELLYLDAYRVSESGGMAKR